jgi:hypothetical protein
MFVGVDMVVMRQVASNMEREWKTFHLQLGVVQQALLLKTACALVQFKQRFSLLTYSRFALLSAFSLKHKQKRDNAEIDVPAAAKWAVACAAISFVLTLFVVVGHLIPLTANIFVGTMVEGVLTFVLICFWAATVSIVTNASNGLSVSEADATNQVSNGNLYYFSWAGFVTSIVIMVDYLRSSMGVDVVGEMRNRSARLTLWAGLLAASLVVMGSSARVFGESCTSDDFYAASYCKRTKFGIALGTITMTLAVVVVALKLCLSGSSFLIEFVSAFLLSIMNAFGVAYITSSFGPGKSSFCVGQSAGCETINHFTDALFVVVFTDSQEVRSVISTTFRGFPSCARLF